MIEERLITHYPPGFPFLTKELVFPSEDGIDEEERHPK
jgi:hypothetical protein